MSLPLRNLAATLMLVWAPVASAQEVTIAALGDSLTQGYGLAQGDGFVPQLQRWLDEQGANAQVINAGVSGDTTAGGLARLGWTLTDEVDALIVALGSNDMLRGIDPSTVRGNLDAILAEADARGLPVLLVSVEAPLNYGADYKAAFDAIYPELAEAYGAILADTFFAPLITAAEAGEGTQAEFMQADGLHPSAAGVAVIVEALGPRVVELIEVARGG